MKILGYDVSKPFDYENGFYITSPKSRISKILGHYEIYNKIINLDGDIVEFGVFKGASLIRFATFRDIIEKKGSRKIIGFDAFGQFPRHNIDSDNEFADYHDELVGYGIPFEDLKKCLKYKKIDNVELIKGDILKTLPKYLEKNNNLKIALLHIDVDVYLPTKMILELLFNKVVKNGIILLDEYNEKGGEGESRAVNEFYSDKEFEPIKMDLIKDRAPTIIIK